MAYRVLALLACGVAVLTASGCRAPGATRRAAAMAPTTIERGVGIETDAEGSVARVAFDQPDAPAPDKETSPADSAEPPAGRDNGPANADAGPEWIPSPDGPTDGPSDGPPGAGADPPPPRRLPTSEEVAPPPLALEDVAPLTLDQVVVSVQRHFPLVEAAAAGRVVASGEALAAAGAFDHKLEAYSESQPLDFYENYQNGVGVKRDTGWGGQVFAGYRIGRDNFEPWYLERETNKGGEFKAGFVAPIIQDRWTDPNRAELWRAELEQQRVEPEVRAQLIGFVRDGSVAYWSWVAASADYRIATRVLRLARERNRGLEEQVKAQEKAPLDLVDNRRIVVSREAKQIDARRKLEQAALKLSLFYRGPDGAPRVPPHAAAPEGFPTPDPYDLLPEVEARAVALANRPELQELFLQQRQLEVALRQANNETLPDVDGGLLVAQDVGEPTSSKRDKSEFELEARLLMSVPLERRKALGKARQTRGKIAQVQAKRRFVGDKVAAEVGLARAALTAALERVERATESYRLAEQVRDAEATLFREGQSTLFNLNAREQQSAEAAAERIVALLDYHVARADYAAALGVVR